MKCDTMQSMRSQWMFMVAAVAVLPAFVVQIAAGQNAPAQKSAQKAAKKAPASKDNPSDWPMYTRDLGGTRFSPLTQINTANVGTLTQAWIYRLRDPNAPAAGRGDAKGKQAKGGPAGASAEGAEGGPAEAAAAAAAASGANPEATPIVVNGVMYLPGGNRVLALDPESGKEIWQSKLPFATSARGVAYWPGDHDNPPRIIFTAGPRLVALNANTGNIDPGFGKEGIVDIKVPWNGVPTIYQERGDARRDQSARFSDRPARRLARIRCSHGAKLWEFHSVPQPGEPGFGTWEDDTWKDFSGINVWGWYMTVDEARGILYMPFGSPGGKLLRRRPARQNLFGNSVVAVDAPNRQVHMALSDRASRLCGIRIFRRRRFARYRAEGQKDSRAGADRQAELDVHSESRDGQAGFRRGGASGCPRAMCPASCIRRRNRSR